MLSLFLAAQLLTTDDNGRPLLTNVGQLGSVPQPAVRECHDYDRWIDHYGRVYGVDPQLVRLIIDQESNFNPRAVSRSGAMGLMQLMPETAERLGVRDPFDPESNLRGGIKFLSDLQVMFDGDLELVLAAYHAGPGIVGRLRKVPAIPETIAYVDYIVSRYGGTIRRTVDFRSTDEGVPLLTNRPR